VSEKYNPRKYIQGPALPLEGIHNVHGVTLFFLVCSAYVTALGITFFDMAAGLAFAQTLGNFSMPRNRMLKTIRPDDQTNVGEKDWD
jgi:hypothetical protein